MRVRDSKVTAALLAAVVVVGGVNVAAYAGNGHAFLLGRHNKETKPSHLVNRHRGPALTLHTKKSSVPLKVNSKRKVKHLNADRVDGKSAGALETRPIVYSLPTVTAAQSQTVRLGGLAKGVYEVSYSVFLFTDDIVTCQVWIEGTPTLLAMSGNADNVASGSGVIDLRKGGRPSFQCYDRAGGSVSEFTWYPPQSQVVVTRLDGVTKKQATFWVPTPVIS